MKLTKTQLIKLIKTIPKNEKITGINVQYDVESIPTGKGIMDLVGSGLKRLTIYFNNWEGD